MRQLKKLTVPLVMLSGLIAMTLDYGYGVETPPLHWLIGIIGGLCGGLCMGLGEWGQE